MKKETLQYLEYVRKMKEVEKEYEKEINRIVDEHIAKQHKLMHDKEQKIRTARENLRNEVTEVCRQQIMEKKRRHDEAKTERNNEAKKLSELTEQIKIDSENELHQRRQNIETYHTENNSVHYYDQYNHVPKLKLLVVPYNSQAEHDGIIYTESDVFHQIKSFNVQFCHSQRLENGHIEPAENKCTTLNASSTFTENNQQTNPLAIINEQEKLLFTIPVIINFNKNLNNVCESIIEEGCDECSEIRPNELFYMLTKLSSLSNSFGSTNSISVNIEIHDNVSETNQVFSVMRHYQLYREVQRALHLLQEFSGNTKDCYYHCRYFSNSTNKANVV
ncbi:unnamed protein product [Trichobilharzia regenti]|nr:unnamed protein product [Trichobilharzia regenti]